ncbi:hypothetical protein DNTS_026885 [Danionella cerebrum]|uniref:Fibronectin type-III domain-containing protein n=1 Tax=Danionella cerebrum TaxID=2873325 RepID=A0A553QE46_9TELE|nr:hypothetical protein DNTS_026885 [Danionella translucida]
MHSVFSLQRDNMQALLVVFFSEILLLMLTSASTLKEPRQTMRLRISAVGDTIVFKFIRPKIGSRIEGYILGYGSSMFSKQFIPFPEDEQPFETEIDAEPKYLISVQSKNPDQLKKQCAVRYREKQPSNSWNYQTCPTTSTVIDDLKPDTLYEFAVRADTDSKTGVWSPSVIHNTADPKLEPFKELNQAKPKKPIFAGQQGFFPPVPRETTHNRNPDNYQASTTDHNPAFSRQRHLAQLFFSIPPLDTKCYQEIEDSWSCSSDSLYKDFPRHHGKRPMGLWGNRRQKPRKQHEKPKSNQVSETKEKEEVFDLKQRDPVPDLKPLVPPSTVNPANQVSSPTIVPQSAFEDSQYDSGDNSSIFSPHPRSELDPTGKKRFIAPHVIYRTDKRPEEPCSVTNSLSSFPDEEVGYLNVTSPPKTPPSNLTVVTVEGCPSFVILDWDKTDNETTEYEVVSSTKGPHGEEVSIQTTNQTHTAVENLKPESSYAFKVTPKNELGSGPSSDLVSFSTESADPRVSERTSKTAIWSSFPFKADSYSECNGRQFIKRTWYRKFVGIQLCNSLRYKIYLSDTLGGKFYSIGDQTGFGEDHCQFVDSFLDGRTGGPLPPDQLPSIKGFYRAMRQEPVMFGDIGGNSMINYVAWYECGIPVPGKW